MPFLSPTLSKLIVLISKASCYSLLLFLLSCSFLQNVFAESIIYENISSENITSENIIELSIAEPKSFNPNFTGYNANMMAAMSVNPWSRSEIHQLFKDTGTAMVRYPGGTIANHFDWPSGNQIKSDGSLGNYDYKISNFKQGYAATNFAPIYVVNLLTRDLQHTLDGLADITAKGLPLTHIELGNEFFLKDSDYVAMFPSGQDYVNKADIWTEAIKALYPSVKIAYVSTMKSDPRSLEWNEKVAQCRKCDAIIIHTYTRSELDPSLPASGNSYWGTAAEQNQQWSQFKTQAGVAKMLAQPFEAWQGYTSLNNLPSDKEIWITEFNMKDGTGPTRNTWAHALFNANQIQSFLVDGRVSIALLHNLITGAKSGSHYLGTTFSGLSIDHQQGDLSSIKYSLSAGGFTMRAFGTVLSNMDEISALEIPQSPNVSASVSVSDYSPYSAIYGWQASNSATSEKRYLLVNTSASALTVNTENLAATNQVVRQYWAKPHTFIHSEKSVSGGLVNALPKLLTLPAYSITTVGEPLNIEDEYSSSITLTASDDHYANQAKPEAKGKTNLPQMNINNTPDSQLRPLVKFNLSKIKGTIQSATLRVFSETTADDISVYQVNNNWDENELTWQTMPALGTLLNTSAATTNSWLSLDVTSALPSKPSLISFALTANKNTTSKFTTKEANKAPELIITTSNAALTINNSNITKAAANVLRPYDDTLLNLLQDDDGDSLFYRKISGPSWLMVWPNGAINGTPTASDVGQNAFSIMVSDNSGQSSAQALLTVNIEVISDVPINSPPFWLETSNNLTPAEENLSYQFELSALANDNDDDSLTFSKISGPNWLSIAESGGVSGIPTAAEVGINRFIIAVTDGQSSVSTEINIDVKAAVVIDIPNQVPTWQSSQFSLPDASEDTAYNFDISSFASDVENDNLLFNLVTASSWLTVDAQGILSGTPRLVDVGEQSFEISVFDPNTDNNSDNSSEQQATHATFTLSIIAKPEVIEPPVEIETPLPSPEPTPESSPVNESQPSGGSFAYIILLLLAVLIKRQKTFS